MGWREEGRGGVEGGGVRWGGGRRGEVGWREEGRGGVEGGGVRWGRIQSLSRKSTTHTHIHTHSSRVRGVNFVHAYVLVTCGREDINKRVLHHNEHSHPFHTTSDP